MIRVKVIGAIAGLCVIAAAYDLAFPLRPKWLYNPSASAPIGWYEVSQSDDYKRGDLVAAYAPMDAPMNARSLADKRGYLPFEYPLIKTVWAVAGDKVCTYNEIDSSRVSGPNGSVLPRLSQDRLGRDMPLWTGCMTLTEGQYFIASLDHIDGWDSRYFGPVEKSHILGIAVFIGPSEKGGVDGNE